VGENTALEEKICGKSSMLLCLFLLELVFSSINRFLVSISTRHKDDLLAALVDSQSFKARLEREVELTGRLRTVINDISASWELEPANENREVARGDALVDQLCYLGATLRDRVWDAFHTRVKWVMSVVYSGFSYDMEVVSYGFITDISKTDAENEERLHALIDEAEVPGERLANLFEPEVLPPETGVGTEEGGEGRDED